MSDYRWTQWGLDHEQTAGARVKYAKERYLKRQRASSAGNAAAGHGAGTGGHRQRRKPDPIFYELKHEAGQAPGPDGVTYRDLGRSEVRQHHRDLSRTILGGSYRPGQPGRCLSRS